jgi:hypothetical protein
MIKCSRFSVGRTELIATATARPVSTPLFLDLATCITAVNAELTTITVSLQFATAIAISNCADSKTGNLGRTFPRDVRGRLYA